MDLFAPARAALASLQGEAGAFASDADGHALFCENEDELFPSASVIKLPLVMTLYADAARSLVDLDERFAFIDQIFRFRISSFKLRAQLCLSFVLFGQHNAYH